VEIVMRKLIFLFFLIFSSVNFCISDEIDLGEIVITATKTEKSIFDTPASINIIGSKEIENLSSQNNLSEIVKTEGILSQNIGGFAGVTEATLSIRGIQGINTTLILVDGQPLNESFTGGINMNILPLNTISKIEIVKGPFSSLYGSYAMGGVINIITKNYIDKNYLILEKGNFNYDNFEMMYNLKKEKISYILTAGRKNTDNYFAEDIYKNYDYEDEKISLKTIYEIENDKKITFTNKYFKSESGFGYTSYITPKREKKQEKESFSSNINFKDKFKNLNYNISLSMYYPKTIWYKEDQIPSSGPPKFVPSIMKWSSYDTIISLSGELHLNEKNRILSGIEKIINDAESETRNQDTKEVISSVKKNVETFAFYLQDEYLYSEKLKFILGARYDNHSSFGDYISPKFSFIYKFQNDKNLYLSLGKAFRAPTIGELYTPDFVKGTKTFRSNPNLNPEKVTSYELGANFKNRNIKYRIAIFKNNLKDLISLVPVDVNIEQYQNIRKAVTDGFEFDLNSQNKYFQTKLNYTYLNTEDKTLKQDLEYSPKNLINLQLTYTNPRFSTILTTRYTDAQFYIDRRTQKKIILPSYIVNDINFIFRINKKSEIKVSIKNLNDKKYQEYGGYDAPGRTWTIGLKSEF
jgi:outer membrane cobalamin receptor